MLKHINLFSRNLGYSLIELIITIVLTSIVMVIFYTIFGQGQLGSISPVMQVKASQLAQAYMEEIVLKRFDENSPAGNGLRCGAPTAIVCSATLTSDGESRIQFDDVDDYNGLVEKPPRDALNVIRSGFDGFQVSITVTYAGADFGQPATYLKLIELTVTSSENDNFVFSQYRGNF